MSPMGAQSQAATVRSAKMQWSGWSVLPRRWDFSIYCHNAEDDHLSQGCYFRTISRPSAPEGAKRAPPTNQVCYTPAQTLLPLFCLGFPVKTWAIGDGPKSQNSDPFSKELGNGNMGFGSGPSIANPEMLVHRGRGVRTISKAQKMAVGRGKVTSSDMYQPGEFITNEIFISW